MLKVTMTGLDPKKWATKVKKQATFATATAINATAKVVQAESGKALERELDRPTPFTKRTTGFSGSMFLVGARSPAKLYADVGFKDIQSAYLMFQFAGGIRKPKNKALRIPADVRLNQYGNLPKDTIKKLRSQAKGKGSNLFYGQPTPASPAGIWKRVGKRLQAVILFPQRAARYKRKFDWFTFARGVAKRELPRQFDIAFANAMRTAR